MKRTDPGTVSYTNPGALRSSDWSNERHETRHGKTPALLSSCGLWKWWVQKLAWINKNILMAALSCRMYNNTEAFPNNAVRLICDMCMLERLLFFFWALLQFHPVLCDELHVKPSPALHRLHKVYQNNGAFGVTFTLKICLGFSRDRIALHNCDMMEFRRLRGNSHFLLRAGTCSHFSISRKCWKICWATVWLIFFEWHVKPRSNNVI